MEFLQSLFNDKSLTFEDLAKAIKEYNEKPENKDKQIKVGNLGSGDYVARNKYETKVNELSAANTQIATLNTQIQNFAKDGDASKLEADLETLQQKYKDDVLLVQKETAIKDYLHEKGVKHADLLMKEFDLEEVEITEKGKVKGIDKQFETLAEKYADLMPSNDGEGDGDEGDYHYEPETGSSGSHESGSTDFMKVFSENRLIKD